MYLGGFTGQRHIIGGENTPSVEANQKSKREERITNTTLVAGALSVFVENIGVGGNINVNGKDISPGGIFSSEAFHNQAANKTELVEEVIIISNGNEFSFHVAYPSTNPVDINTI